GFNFRDRWAAGGGAGARLLGPWPGWDRDQRPAGRAVRGPVPDRLGRRGRQPGARVSSPAPTGRGHKRRRGSPHPRPRRPHGPKDHLAALRDVAGRPFRRPLHQPRHARSGGVGGRPAHRSRRRPAVQGRRGKGNGSPFGAHGAGTRHGARSPVPGVRDRVQRRDRLPRGRHRRLRRPYRKALGLEDRRRLHTHQRPRLLQDGPEHRWQHGLQGGRGACRGPGFRPARADPLRLDPRQHRRPRPLREPPLQPQPDAPPQAAAPGRAPVLCRGCRL
ncbi:MAG: hypothetical protein AVDCRST_MAG55-1546, partial [uncultured Rubrobacteraceae bacterium]